MGGKVAVAMPSDDPPPIRLVRQGSDLAAERDHLSQEVPIGRLGNGGQARGKCVCRRAGFAHRAVDAGQALSISRR